jgi:hypothetical protein
MLNEMCRFLKTDVLEPMKMALALQKSGAEVLGFAGDGIIYPGDMEELHSFKDEAAKAALDRDPAEFGLAEGYKPGVFARTQSAYILSFHLEKTPVFAVPKAKLESKGFDPSQYVWRPPIDNRVES